MHIMKSKVKIVAMSDMHGYLPKDVEECDVVCICGDVVPLEYQSDMVRSISWLHLKFFPWINSLHCDKVIMIPGNHDFVFEWLGPQSSRTPSEVMKKLLLDHKKDSKLVILWDNSYDYKGYRFYGFPWIPDLHRWAFYKDHDELVNRCNNIPKKCDVLLTHCPPRYGRQGMVYQPNNFNHMNDFGCKELAEAMTHRDIKWCLSGHVHTGSHSVEEHYMTKCVNVSLLDEDYKPVFEPTIIELG